MNTMDQEPKSYEPQTSVIGIRCPKCLKLYAVDTTEVHEAKPKFQCNKCNTRFWIPFPTASSMSELIGFPVSWIEDSDVNKFVPPAIKENFQDSNEQSSALFSKFHQDVGVPHSRKLRDLWNVVVEDYNNHSLHLQFVKACQRENNLAFATKKYAHILNTVSNDEVAIKMIREIDGMVQAWITNSHSMKSNRIFRNRLVWFGVSTGLVLVALGLSFMQLRNLVGIGAVLSFLTLALQGFFPSKN